MPFFFRTVGGSIGRQIITAPSNTHCAAREHCIAEKYCEKNTTFNPDTKVCEPNKPNDKK